MNLERTRIELTATYAVLSAIAVGLLAFIAIRTGTDRIFDSAEREADQRIADAYLNNEPVNTWILNYADDWLNYQGPPDTQTVEPPVFTLALQAVDRGTRFSRFEQNGTWLAVAEPIDNSEDSDPGNDTLAFVSAIDLDPYQADVSSLRWRIIGAALAAVAAVTAIGWFVAGRSLAPARTAIAQQRDFIADAAHELRTPLSVIRASASQSLSRPRDGEAYRESLVEINEAAERASEGVGELLEFARLEAGQGSVRLAPLRLDLLVEEVGGYVRREGVVVEAVPGEAIVVDADYNLLRQALDAIARNAVARSTKVRLTSRLDDRMAVVEVTDDGPGFPEEMLPHLFDRYRRGDQKGSSGLGMAITRRLVEAHHGDVFARNGEEGGAVVGFELPLSSAHMG